MKVIDLEAHFASREYMEYVRSREGMPGSPGLSREGMPGGPPGLSREGMPRTPRASQIRDGLDLGEGRLKVMDAVGIDMQVLSVAPPNVQQFEASEGTAWSRKVNDELSAAVKKYPDRFIGLAAVAPQSPGEAADELERAVTELGLKGVCIRSHARDEYLDDRKYWVIFERAEKLDVPIYLHPAIPSKDMLKPYADYGLSGPVLGFAADLALHTMRLIFSGMLDTYPKLKIILGHMGEGLPFWLSRIDFAWLRPNLREKLAIERRPSEYIKTNFTITTSGMFFQPALICAYLALGADKITFAVDYPHEENEKALQFMKEAPICDSDKEKIYHLNAERLFKL